MIQSSNLGFQFRDGARRCRLIQDLLLDDLDFVVRCLIKVLHVVTSLETAKEAIDAGVDGLVVEGIEGAGLKGRTEVASSVLLPA